MLDENINISQYRRGAEAIVNQLNEICGGDNPMLKLGFLDQCRGPRNTPNTLSSILREYSNSLHAGEGIGHIGLEWKGPFPLHSLIIQHIKRIQLLVGRPPSLTYGVLPYIKYGYVGLENILYIFKLDKMFENSTEPVSPVPDFEALNDSNDKKASIGDLNSKILTLSLPFPIKMVTGSFPRANIFSKDIEYLLCVITEKSANLMALKLHKCEIPDLSKQNGGHLTSNKEVFNEFNVNHKFSKTENDSEIKGAGLINIPIMKIGEKEVNTFQCSLPKIYASNLHSLQATLDGRFFFFEEQSSNVYEFVYHSKEGWITPYCYIHSHKMNSVLADGLLFKYTFLKIFQRISISRVSVAPCGYMAILDSFQNIHIIKYLNDSNSNEIFSLITPWGRVVNSIESWTSNVDLKSYMLPSDWDDYVYGSENQHNIHNLSHLTEKMTYFDSKKYHQGRFSSPSSLKIISTFKRAQLIKIFSKLSGKQVDDDKNDEFKHLVIKNISLSFTYEYNLALSLFMDNGSVFQFQCSKKRNEYMPPLNSILNDFSKSENKSQGSPFKKIQIPKINDIFGEIIPSVANSHCKDDTIFGFWLINFIPCSMLTDEKSNITNSYYRNGLTIITRNTTCKTVKNMNANTDFSKIPSRNICQVEVRLFNSFPADINLNLSKHIHGFQYNQGIANSPSSSLRYKSNLPFSGGLNKCNGEPIILEFDEQIKYIYEFDVNSDHNVDISEEFPWLMNLKSLISPNIILEYSGNSFGKKNNLDLLGWINDRHIILFAETHCFLLTLKWNGIHDIIGASGLFMQIMQNQQLNNRVDTSNNNFRRLVHPEDSFLITDYLSLTSPWIEALSGAIAFDLKSILELPLFYKSEDDRFNLLLNTYTLEFSFSKLHKVMRTLSRSRNIIGNEFFNLVSLPNNKHYPGRSINEVLMEELGADYNLQLKKSTAFVIKSIAFIVNILSQLVKFLMVFISSSEDVKRLTFMYFERDRNTELLTEMPLIFLLVSNRGIYQIRCLVKSFLATVIDSVTYFRDSNAGLVSQLKVIHPKIGWLLNDEARKIIKRLTLFQELSEDPDIYSILEKITSKISPIGSFPDPPYKYWESFLLDQTQNGFLREIFSSLTLKPWNRVGDSTILLLKSISYFELFLTEQMKYKQITAEFLGTNGSDGQNIHLDSFSGHIDSIIKSWTDSLSDSLFDRTSCERDDKATKTEFLDLFTQPIRILISHCNNKKLVDTCLKHLLRDVLTPIIEKHYISAENEKNIDCICQQLLNDFQLSIKFESNQNGCEYNKPLLILIPEEINSIFKSKGPSEKYIYSNSQLVSILSNFITCSNYSPFYFILSSIYLMNRDDSFNAIKSASILSFIAFNANICCKQGCRNIQTRIDCLKLLRRIFLIGNRSLAPANINVSDYFPHLFDEKFVGKNRHPVDFSIDNAISNAESVISCSSYLQIPLLNYLEKHYILNGNNSMFDMSKALSSRIYSFPEITSIINSCPDLQPFLIISTLFDAGKNIPKDDSELEELCSLISDLLLQTIFPPRGHTIFYSNGDYNIDTPTFPILNYFFEFCGYSNYHESIRKLFEFIQTPLINITGSSFLSALSLAPNTYQSVGLSNQEIIERYDLFQQLYSISAVLEFGNFYILKSTQDVTMDKFIPTSLSIKLWNKYFSIPHDLIFDVYISLLDSCTESPPSSNPYGLILNRIAALESPVNDFESLSNDNNSFALHIRKCIVGIIQNWINDSVNLNVSPNHAILIRDFINASTPIIRNHDNKDEKLHIISIFESVLSKL